MDTDLPSISPIELARLIGRPDAPLLLDVRRRERFAESPWLLPGARYCAPEDVAAFARSEPAREVVTCCVFGHHVSHDAARALRDAGWKARYLQGGIEGGEDGIDGLAEIVAWRAAPVLRMRKRPDLGVTGERHSRWITRARPKIDRIACPWLILRFIDPRAEFLYVPAEQVLQQARAREAVPFDIDGVLITHQWEKCSFDALMEAFGLEDPALATLATIVRGADTARVGLTPQSGGLLALSLGLSLLHADDHAMLQVALPMYDALYTWCRHGQAEQHTWSAHAAAGA